MPATTLPITDARVRLATVALYGDPSPTEPLHEALSRALDRLFLAYEPADNLTDRLRARVIAGLPGDGEADKVARVLDEAPDWLNRLCHH